MKNCVIKQNMGVLTEWMEESREVVDYLISCGIVNSHKILGNSTGLYFRTEEDNICFSPSAENVNYISFVSYDEFKELISTPTKDTTINNYKLY